MLKCSASENVAEFVRHFRELFGIDQIEVSILHRPSNEIRAMGLRNFG